MVTTTESADKRAASASPPWVLVPSEPGIDPRFAFKVSVAPVRFVGSAASGWEGAFLADVSAAPSGEARHDHRTLVIQHWLTPDSARPIGGAGGWTTLAPGIRLRFPGDAEHVAWRGSPRGRFLFVTPERLEALLGIRWEESGLTRWREARYHLPFVEHVIAAMMMDVETRYPAGPLTGDALIVALLRHLNGREVAPRPPRSGGLGRRLDVVRDYIEANLAKPLRLSDVAAQAGIGVRRFGAVFAAETGWSPHRYVLFRRVERAKELMRDRTLSLAQISRAVGFTDPAQFSRVFRQYAGEAPRTYRGR